MKFLMLLCAATALSMAPALPLHGAEPGSNPQEPALVVQAYVRATSARDFIEAYRYISAEDRRVRDLDRYVRQRGALTGFALEAARKLTESVEIKPILRDVLDEVDRAEVAYGNFVTRRIERDLGAQVR